MCTRFLLVFFALAVLALKGPVPAAHAAPDWLDAMNAIRAATGLAPVVVNTDRNAGPTTDDAVAHSRYLVLNNLISHDETPGLPGYSDAGRAAGMQGDVSVDFAAINPVQAVQGFLVSGYHWEPILDPSTTAVAFGIYTDPAATGWQSAATLVFIRNGGGRGATLVLWPPDGGQLPAQYTSRNPGESPDPMANCPNFPTTTGAAIAAQFSNPPQVTAVTLTMDGAAAPLTACWFTAATVTFGASDIGTWDNVGLNILTNQNVLNVFPQQPLGTGVYHVSVTKADGSVCSWSFSVGLPAPPPDRTCIG